jgi:hypothetical protein
MKGKHLVAAAFVFGMICLTSNAQAKWNFGIGTGPQFLAVKGDFGMDTAVGPIKLNMDLDFNDMEDLVDTAFGFGGYVTDSRWMIQYKLGKLQLEDSETIGFGKLGALSAKVNFDITEAEITVGYPILEGSSYLIRGYGGLRYLKQELDLLIVGRGFLGINGKKSLDESWTDLLVGLSADVRFAQKWNWNVKVDAGFFGSEGTYLASTGITWRFYKGWSITGAATYRAVEYENSSRGATDWYLYDVEETNIGLTILYNW